MDDPSSLTIRRVIAADPARLFDAWVDAAQLMAWWGPEGVACISASIDARVGGEYRIGNLLPDGSVLWICGRFVEISRPDKLVFEWSIEGASAEKELVAVEFAGSDDGRSTEVIVRHMKIKDLETREGHEAGWIGCLNGLAGFVARSRS